MASGIIAAVHKEGIRKMDVGERMSVEQEMSALKEELKNIEAGNGDVSTRPQKLQEIPAIKRRISQLEELLNKDDDLIPKGPEKDGCKKRVKEIEAIIKKEMPTEREQSMRMTNGAGDFERAVEKTIHHQKKYGELIREWQELMRRLEPEDPNAADVSKLVS